MEPSTEGLGLGFTPIGPTWDLGTYFLGADNQGRDVAARLLYGGRNSLVIAGAVDGDVPGARGHRRPRRRLLRRRRRYACCRALLDVLWAFPVYLLAISLSIVLISQGIDIGPITINAGSLWLPIFIIGIVYVPYVARPIRGQVLALTRERVRAGRDRPRRARAIAFCSATSCPM